MPETTYNVDDFTRHEAIFGDEGKTKGTIVIYSNIDTVMGEGTFEAAMVNWWMRTDTMTAKSLCDYIMSKQVYGVLAITEEELQPFIDEATS